MNIRLSSIRVTLIISLLLLTPTAWAANGAAPAASAAPPPVVNWAADNNVAIQLGKVKVTGARKVIRALQIIKVALNTPESSDPKLANVVVCRLHYEVGSHATQVLQCATNRDLAKRRDVFQRTTTSWIANCGFSCGIQTYIDAWNEVLSAQPENVLTMEVNGPAFRNLLEKVPPLMTKPQTPTPPTSATTHP